MRQGLPSHRYFTVPRPLLQSIVATTGTTPAVFPRGSSINVAAQLTALTNSAPALARHSQPERSAAAGRTVSSTCFKWSMHKVSKCKLLTCRCAIAVWQTAFTPGSNVCLQTHMRPFKRNQSNRWQAQR